MPSPLRFHSFSVRRIARSSRTALGATVAAVATLAALAAVGAVPATANAQLSLRDALRLADRSGFANRAASGASAEQRGHTLASLRGVLPSAHIDAGYVRTTDPIGTFGATLRQRVITAADFDPAHLNYPSPVGNYQAGMVVEQPLLNADAWLGRNAARSAERATQSQEQWTRISTRTDVIRAYYGAILAGERVATLQHAAAAAHAHVAQAETMVRNGLATKSDALLAAVHAGDVDAQLVEARGAAESMTRQLQLALGQTPSGGITLPAALPTADRIRAFKIDDAAPGERADVDAARSALEAARADQLRARSTLLPRLNGFARYDWNSPARLYAGERNWTVGVMASWSVFSGASELADAEASAGRATAARAQADASAARARAETDDSKTALSVALARIDIAERAAAQSAEAHRIVARKYDGGLATVVELFDAQAVETQSMLGLAQARYAAIVAAAERLQALGLDPAGVAALDEASTVAAAATSPQRDADSPPR